MGFREKVLKIIVEAGQEQTVKEISDAISTRAFFDLKDKFEKLQKEIQEKHDNQLIKKIEDFEKTLKETVKKEIKEQKD